MNRLKLWLYLALLLVAGIASVVGLSRSLTHRAVAQVDRELGRAVAQVDARSQLLAMEAAQLADAVARDPAVLQALASEGEGRAASAVHSAAQAARGAAADSARSQLVAISGRGGRAFSVNGASVQGDSHLESLVSGAAADAARREAYAVVGDSLYYVVAAPAARGTAVAVGVPANTAWLGQLRSSTGADVTLLLDQRPPRGTLAPRQAEAVANAVRGATGPVDVGSLPAQAGAFGSGIPSPSLPLLFASAPEYRAQPVALRGLAGGVLAVSQGTSALLAPVVGYGWLALAGLVVLLLVGVGTALSVTNEQETVIPRDLLSAADRITRRDFTARAPVMAGSLGTVAAALNCAAEAARSAGGPSAEAASPPVPVAAEVAAEAAAADPFAQFSQPSGSSQAQASAQKPAAAETEAAAQEPVPAEETVAAGRSDAAQEAAAAQDSSAARDGAGAPMFAAAVGSGDPPDHAATQDALAFAWPPAQEPSSPEPTASPDALAGEGLAPADSGLASASGLAETADLGSATRPAEPEELLGAATQEAEPAAAESRSLPFLVPVPENGALPHVPEQPASSLDSAMNTVASAAPAAEPNLFEPAAAAAHVAAEPAAERQPEPAPLAAIPPPVEPTPVPPRDGDEEHWRVTYDEFVKVREQCGESRQGVPYERFRQKLQKNRDQLVAKYGCRTVRFQVYVKEGRAALKASPVR